MRSSSEPCAPPAAGIPLPRPQVALIVFMAHIGSFVPAEAANVPLVDCILTRIHTRDSVAQVSVQLLTLPRRRFLCALPNSAPSAHAFHARDSR